MRHESLSQLDKPDADMGIDIAQLRGDLRMFVDETKRELDQILEQLHSEKQLNQRQSSFEDAADRISASPSNTAPSRRDAETGLQRPLTSNREETSANSRLAQLKQQLADRLERARNQQFDGEEIV
jgi:hypothetical protein